MVSQDMSLSDRNTPTYCQLLSYVIYIISKIIINISDLRLWSLDVIKGETCYSV